MDGRNKQTAAIKFCFKAGPSVTETQVLVQKDYGNEAQKQSNVFRRYSWFQDKRELVEDDERGGHPKLTRTKVNIAAADLVKYEYQITSRMIADSLNIPKTLVLQILEEDLGKRKLCARFVPHSTPEQREDWVTSCQDSIMMADADNFFLTKLLRAMRPGVLPMTLKDSDRVLNGLVRRPLRWRNWNSIGPASRQCW